MGLISSDQACKCAGAKQGIKRGTSNNAALAAGKAAKQTRTDSVHSMHNARKSAIAVGFESSDDDSF